MIRRIISPAKINLFLHVIGKRSDGFHELKTLITPIALFDKIELDVTGITGIKIQCDYPGVPEDSSNLAYRAAELFFDQYNSNIKRKLPIRGINIRIKKRIPPGRGLGGGSSNAAAILMALNQIHRNPFSKIELASMGLAIGADVPFFLTKGPAIVTGIGEKLEPMPNLKGAYLIVCDPGVKALTTNVFKNFQFGLTLEKNYTISDISKEEILRANSSKREEIRNDLENIAFKLYPEIGSAKKEIESLLKRKVLMSGSGSSLFILFSKPSSLREGVWLLRKKWEKGSRRIFISSFQKKKESRKII